jgi:murein DD-endopeptidase MepM/ murein hydrolase activator NlpD
VEDASFILLAVLALVAFNAYRQGNLGQLLRAKFLNAGQPPLPIDRSDVDTSSGTGVTARPSSFVQSFVSGLLGRPLPGVADPTSSGLLFGAPRVGHTHAGVDWIAPTGTPVLSAAGGTVRVAGAVGGYGLAVYVDHGNGLETRYGHLSKIGVRQGDPVNAGQQLGLVGATGNAQGPHLHFEVRQNGVAINPLGALQPATHASVLS